ncbi:uncharacterized protein LOC119835956 [Zerene cesonia]|uniref:uncharacterized protein LOC119835956 n=1 Tax=Zerene cesonia TaxID=33412 RepID=UPI0018E53941|nr:uncharacterized protein LOC119835956 [Zerene cesonia]
MFGRPRCREWTPLTTQQLRLRSLIQIVGYNIRPPEWCTHQCSYYLTLHHTTMSAPFYTSERISSPHPKWKEIDSEITQRMSSTNVVIRIWCHIIPQSSKEDEEKCEQIQDTVIQTWGVYFSGLRYIGANLALNFNSDCFKSNTLVFQMHGGYFCSYKSLKLDIIPPENEIEHGSLSSDSSGHTNVSRIFDKKLVQSHKLIKDSRSLSPGKYSKKIDKEYSKSHSPIDKGFKQNFPTLRTSSSLNIAATERRRDESNERKKPETNHIYEHSPDNLDVKEFRTSEHNCDINASQEDLSSKIDLSETAESYDLRNETDGVPKYRYLALNFLKSEIRPSYTATKLQNLHLLQYAIKKRQEAVQEIKERIYQKSALSDTITQPEFEEKLKSRSRSQRNLFSCLDEEALQKSSSQTDLSVKNGRVKEGRSPVSNGPRLTLKLNDLLSYKSKPSPYQRSEHVRLTKQLEILHFKRLILSDERDSKLANIRRLKEIHAKLFEENQDVGSELMTNYHTLSRRTEALKEKRDSCAALRELAARSHATLCNCRSDLLLHLQKIFYIQQPSELAERYKFHQRKQKDNETISEYVAVLKKMSKTCEYGTRSDTSKLFGFATWAGGAGGAGGAGEGARAQSLRSLVACERGGYGRQFNRFKDCVDGQSPHRMLNEKRHKHSRSVGSYHDDRELTNLNTSTTSIMGSESNIYNMRLAETSNFKNHSDSEISKRNDEKVLFTLGDDEKLLKISSNNDDEIDVKRICNEINNFCTIKDGQYDNIDNFDVVKHMNADAKVKCESACAKCESASAKCDSDTPCASDVTDVIVIPSAEAILDSDVK